MAITDSERHILATINEAAKAGDLGLMETTNKAGERVVVVCAITSPDGKQFAAVPLCPLFDKDPTQILNPPDGGKVIDPSKGRKPRVIN